jgi:hypothetical protein
LTATTSPGNWNKPSRPSSITTTMRGITKHLKT